MSCNMRAFVGLIACVLVFAPSPLDALEEPALIWHTFAGSLSYDDCENVAVGPNGNIYLVGTSDAAWGSPIDPHSGGRDVFVAKLNGAGELQWNTFLGSSYEDEGKSIAVDGNGDVLVVGFGEATWDMPDTPFLWGDNAFAAKLNSNGQLQWHTFMTPDGATRALDVTVDAVGNVYVAGWGGWVWFTPEVEPYPDSDGAFVAKLNSNGTELWHALMGSATLGVFDGCTAVAVGASGDVYVAGRSGLTWGSPINPFAGGETDGFVANFDSNGYRQWNTFLGGVDGDELRGIAVDTSDNVYVAGHSQSGWGTPVRPFAGEERHAFAAKLNSAGNRQWHTFMGSENSGELGWDIAVDGGRNVYLTGVSMGIWGIPFGPVLTHPGGFVAELNPIGILQWNYFLEAILDGMALDGNRTIYASGGGDVDWGTPVNPKEGPMGSWDAFVARIGSAAIEIDIDIKPGSDPNCFNINGHGVIPVAINGSADFDVYDIDVGTLVFDGLTVRVRGNKGPLCSIEDWNGDGLLDMVCHFEDDAGAWTGGESSATLTGNLWDGTAIEGTDSICIVP